MSSSWRVKGMKHTQSWTLGILIGAVLFGAAFLGVAGSPCGDGSSKADNSCPSASQAPNPVSRGDDSGDYDYDGDMACPDGVPSDEESFLGLDPTDYDTD